jgi:hypothetical protein
VTVRLHRGGRFRRWAGRLAGGDETTGDRILRRAFHLAGAGILVYYVLPPGLFVVLTTRELLFAGLAGVLVIEAVRLVGRVEVPTLRDYERSRIASYAWYGVALVAAIVLFPEPVAVSVVLGTAVVDPLVGELRRRPTAYRWAYPALPVGVYAALAGLVLAAAGWDPTRLAAGAVVAALVAVAVERPKLAYVDDDLAMTVLPAVALAAIGLVGPSAPLAGLWP